MGRNKKKAESKLPPIVEVDQIQEEPDDRKAPEEAKRPDYKVIETNDTFFNALPRCLEMAGALPEFDELVKALNSLQSGEKRYCRDCHVILPKSGSKRHRDPPLNHHVMLPAQLATRAQVIDMLHAGRHIIPLEQNARATGDLVQVRRLRESYRVLEIGMGLKRTRGMSNKEVEAGKKKKVADVDTQIEKMIDGLVN
jgi:hypothetical protein